VSASLAAPAGDQAKVSISLAIAPAQAFEIFTQEINLWWRRGPRFRNAHGDQGLICLEPRIGGRVFESFGSDAGEVVIEMGRIKVWDPPHRLLFDWRAINFAPAEKTEVEVLFEATASGTRVTVIHRGWSKLRLDHPVRHGLDGPAFSRMIGLWWGDQMRALFERVRSANDQR
jgi:uncharacterized protein YndB with AHSA1/START domain